MSADRWHNVCRRVLNAAQISGPKLRLVIAKALCALAVAPVLFVFGCSRGAQKSASNEVFVTWLQSHGETNIVEDSHETA